MPTVARTVLEQLASGTLPSRLDVGLGPDGGWRVELGED